MQPLRIILVPIFILLLLSCNDNKRDNKLFKKLSSSKTNIDFVNQLDHSDSVSVLEFEYMFNGGGVALIDVNNDSLQDIIFTGNMVSNRLYLNKGNMEFEDITKKAGVESEGWSNGVAVVDINQDGYQDFYVCKAGNYRTLPEKMRNLFFINNGNNTFTESAAKMGLDENGYDINAAFFDYDKDGDLDMYLLRNAIAKANRNISRPKDESGKAESTDKLFRNNGDLTFTDVSKEAGITIEGYGLGVTINDINNDLPPKILLFGILPMLAIIILLFITSGGRRLMDHLHLKSLTWLHVIRVPVEIGLYLLFTLKAIPELMTFEGRNFDIISGLTAPVIAHYGFPGHSPNKKLLIAWNLICIVLLFNIVINALLSVPSPMQRQAFDQPNVAVLQFPFSWLPVFIVPAVLFSHLVAIRQLVKMK